MKKVLIVTPLYPPQIGGPANVAVFLEKSLPSSDFSLRTSKFSAFLKFPTGIRHILFALALLKNVRWAETVITLDPVSVGWPTMLVCKLLKKQYILRVPGDYAWEQGVARYGVTDQINEFNHKDKISYPSKVQKMWRLQCRVAQNAKIVIAQNQYLKSIIKNWGVHEDNIKVIPNPFIPIINNTSKKEARASLNLKQDAKIILSSGRLVKWKGFEKLIQAFSLLETKGVKLYIAGDGPQKEKLEKYIASKGMAKQVHLLGQLSKEKLNLYVKAANCFVLNTSYEGVSSQLLEVMSLGTPIATTTEAGNGDWIVHESNALVFGYNQTKEITRTMEQIINNPEVSERITKGATESLKQFEIEKVIQEYLKLFSELQ